LYEKRQTIRYTDKGGEGKRKVEKDDINTKQNEINVVLIKDDFLIGKFYCLLVIQTR
jgi:hypothetical protein